MLDILISLVYQQYSSEMALNDRDLCVNITETLIISTTKS